MLRLLVTLLAEAVVGLMIGGVLLALTVPVLNRYGIVGPNDLLGAVVIALVLVGTVGAVIFRPGGAMNRYLKR